jgi:uncharacterized membrane protein YphA (DoxX/SURF4 family)
MKAHFIAYTTLVLRLVLGVKLLLSIADRFVIWDPAGPSIVAWGEFITYSKTLTFFIKKEMIVFLGLFITILEILFGIALIIGYKTKLAAMGSSILIFFFAFTITYIYTYKVSFDYSVLIDCAGALLLVLIGDYHYSVDEILKNKI